MKFDRVRQGRRQQIRQFGRGLGGAQGSLAQIASFMGWGLRHAQNVIEHYARLAPDESDRILEALTVAKRGVA